MSVDAQPLISIIVPVYRVEKYLEKCVDSLIKQTYTNLEIILVDDGSPDACPAMCDEFAKNDARIKVIHKVNGGLSDARNAGLEIAKGEYIGFVDSDDFIAVDMYEIMLRSIQINNSDIACCNYLQISEDGALYPNQKLPLKDECVDKNTAFNILVEFGGYYGVAWNKLYSREIIEGIRYPKGRKYEDFFVIAEIINKCKKISHINRAMYYYVRRVGSITLDKDLIKDLDLGYALIWMRMFAIENHISCLHEYSTNRLSYKIEEWIKKGKSDISFHEEFLKMCKLSKFLLYDKYAWEEYSWKGKLVARVRFFAYTMGMV